MFKRKKAAPAGPRLTAESDQVVAAMCRSQAMIEFKLDGTILWANENFLATMGYTLEEIVGKHHAIFVDPAYAAGPDYARFWEDLAKGEFAQAEYRRVGKDGKDVWIQASYNPIMDKDGTPVQVIKFATDITAQKRAAADANGRLSAISASQAVIEFDLDGHILTANENFCNALGYQLEEIKGRHHSLFVDPTEAAGAEYAAFWARLRAGHFDSAEYRRVGKGGQDVWIQASYNPIFDPAGVPYKVVKYATDISARKHAVKLIGEQLEGMAQGRLADQLDTEMPGELEDIRLAVKRTTCQFSAIVERLVRTSRGLREATAEILSGANDLGERTNKQATSVAQTSAAVEQLGTTVKENAERARQAREKANHASTQAQETGAVMGSANHAMEEISKSSKKISNIIGMIDDIAFQTNLLALNASVEAARAGEAGKGFAVVAIEVRRLAQSAASASADVKVLIEASGKEVANGTKLVSGAGQKVDALLSEITQSTVLVDAIAHATSEQAETIREVALAIRHIDEMTQHNSALVEETNAAIEQTENQARHLDSIVETFTLATEAAPGKAREGSVVRLRTAS